MKRLLKTLLLSAKIFLYLFVVKIRNIFGPRSKKLGVSRILDIISSHFSNELGSFRGPLMKAGQFISMIDNSNSQMQPHLEKLLYSAGPEEHQDFATVIENELGRPCSELFQAWDSKVYASGSIGQVYKAQTIEGEHVAVKIKYENLENNIRRDMKTVKLFRYPINAFFQNYDIAGVIEFIEEIMLGECDLLNEAQNYKLLSKIFEKHDDITIPKVYPSLCSQRVLTTEFLEGQRLSEVLHKLEKDELKKIDEALKRFYLYPIQSYNFLQIDPHLGNFLYHKGSIVCLDFGGMHVLDSTGAANFVRFVRAARKGDYLQLYEWHLKESIIDPELISLAIFTKYLGPVITDPFGCSNAENINNLAYYFKNYAKEPLRSGITDKDSELSIYILTYIMFLAIEEKIKQMIDEK